MLFFQLVLCAGLLYKFVIVICCYDIDIVAVMCTLEAVAACQPCFSVCYYSTYLPVSDLCTVRYDCPFTRYIIRSEGPLPRMWRLAHWLSMGRLLRLIQQREAWIGPVVNPGMLIRLRGSAAEPCSRTFCLSDTQKSLHEISHVCKIADNSSCQINRAYCTYGWWCRCQRWF